MAQPQPQYAEGNVEHTGGHLPNQPSVRLDFGKTSSLGNSKFYIDQEKPALYMSRDTDHYFYYDGNNLTITGGNIQTALTGARVAMEYVQNKLSIYDNSNYERVKITLDRIYFDSGHDLPGFGTYIKATAGGAAGDILTIYGSDVSITCADNLSLNYGTSDGIVNIGYTDHPGIAIYTDILQSYGGDGTEAITQAYDIFLQGMFVQSNSTNALTQKQIIQRGWGYLTWSGSTTTSSETVTLPIAFDNANSYTVVATCIGYKSGSNPTSSSDSAGVQDITMECDITGAQTFTIEAKKIDGVNVNSAVRTLYNWVAIGTKT